MTTCSERWRGTQQQGIRPYFESAPLAALFLGISSGFAFSMIGATLTTRLAQHGVTKSAVTAFALTFLAYNFKFLWAPMVDNVRLPVIGRFGQRRSWLWLIGVLVMAAVAFLGIADPDEALYVVAVAAITLGVAGATFDAASQACSVPAVSASGSPEEKPSSRSRRIFLLRKTAEKSPASVATDSRC